ncbi:MAG TPA: tRNA (adenosine(37)-N6)-threonylcarbamoyltransferase complex ATPase subunit type 1 TsaE [Candidatus Moranbacteria bacterium]|nr:tRNA (adenosine(37)-N6)-threonylcarbamoyltransferase complex ATPase subunit type 1 TsaE [Candidatus Moranbacteria bacterium]
MILPLFFFGKNSYYGFMEKKEFITNSLEETQKLAGELARNLGGGEIVCLHGELGAGKTTFTQGLLAELGAEGPYTSPTFLIMKQYDIKSKINALQTKSHKLRTIYHIDAYRISEQDLMNLGWEEIAGNKNNIIILEWPERVKKILPEDRTEIWFEWIDENKRKIIF